MTQDSSSACMYCRNPGKYKPSEIEPMWHHHKTYHVSDSSSELREKLLQYNRDIYAHALLTALAGHLGKNIPSTAGVDAAKEFLPRLEALIAQSNQELLKRIELPDKIDMQSDNRQAIYSEAEDYYNYDLGYNNAIESVQAIINAMGQSQ